MYLIYPLKSLDHYLLRARIVQICKNLFLNSNQIQVSKKKDNLVALRNINFELETNDRCGLIGLNGSGKSTLLSTLSGIFKSSSGYTNIDFNDSIPIIQPYTVCEGDDTVRNNIIVVGLMLGFNARI